MPTIKKEEYITTIKNPAGYKFLLFIAMIYMSVMLLTTVLTNRYIGTDSFFLLGGVFIAPFLFILDDIIAEIYGYKLTRVVILSGYASQTLFVLAAQLVLTAPHPSFFTESHSYDNVLGSSLIRIDLSSFVAYFVANLLNSYILTKWKVLTKGRYFWLRSIGSSTFAELIYSLIAVVLIEFGSISSKSIFEITLPIYAVKVTASIIFALPSQIFVNYIKKRIGIDVYDMHENFTPFVYSAKKGDSHV